LNHKKSMAHAHTVVGYDINETIQPIFPVEMAV